MLVISWLASGASAQSVDWGKAECGPHVLNAHEWKNFVQMQHRLLPDDLLLDGPDIPIRHQVYEKCHEILEYTRHVLNAAGGKKYPFAKRDEYVFGAPQDESAANYISVVFPGRGPYADVIIEFPTGSGSPFFQIQPIEPRGSHFKLTWSDIKLEEKYRRLTEDEKSWLLEAVFESFRNPPDLSGGYPAEIASISKPIIVSVGNWTVTLHDRASNRKAYWKLVSLANTQPPKNRTLNNNQESLPK